MTKVKLKDATKDLLKGAETVMESMAVVRKGADELMQQVRRFESQYSREEEQRRAEEKLAEQQRLLQMQTKAYTMPDTDDEAATRAVPAKAATLQQEETAAAPHTGAKARAAQAKPAEGAPAGAPAGAAPTAAAQAMPPAEGKAPAADKRAVESKEIAEVAPAGEPKAEHHAAAATPAAVAAGAPAHPSATATPATPVARPAGSTAQVADTGNLAPRPAQPMQPRPPMPGAPRGPYGRPANPQSAAPQGPYGRPANPQGSAAPQSGYNRPASPQGGMAPQGPYGRPANPQGPYGRPANPQAAVQPGMYSRPANPPSGGYGRPVGGAPRPPFGRPAGAPGAGPQGGYGRSAGAPGARPAGGFGRPAGGPGGRPIGGPRAAKGPDLAPAVEKERVSNYDPNKKNYVRQHDPERVAKNRKQLARESFSGSDDDVVRGGRRSRVKKPSAQMLMGPIRIEKAFMTAETITVKDLTERIGKPAGNILKKLLLLGVMANINSELDFDTAGLVCNEFGVELEMNLAKTAEDALTETDVNDTEDDLEIRPPVITIMGHVDHGKTSLLDYIRHTHVTAGEAGGITQHIGAYTVTLDGRSITFLDTPGHEAFTAMRARGTQATDIAVLVVAADDGVMPQTIESINHAKAANVPMIIAINKMDKPSADPERVKQDLTAYNLVPEEWGGDTIMVPVSASTGMGVDNLLEMILLQADVLQLRANPNRMAKGVIIEAKLDKARGPLATVLVQNGTLHVGDNIVVGLASGRVRAMVNDKGERVDEAGPSVPVEVSGFSEVPSAGDDMMAVDDDHLGRQVVQERRDKLKVARVANVAKVSLDNLFTQIAADKCVTLNLVIKADVQGSVEAVKQALEKLSNDRVKVRVLHSGVGAITKDDVNLANAFGAIIIGFNIRPDNSARDVAEREGVDVRLYRIIYQAIEDVEKAMKGLLAPEFKEVLLGHAEVRNVFKITGSGTVAGCYVTDGKLQRNAQVRLLRDNVVVFEGKLSSLKRFKDDAKEVAQGYECGASLEGYNDIKEGDTVECFVMEQIER
jgi:translation initiation factor IF-2